MLKLYRIIPKKNVDTTQMLSLQPVCLEGLKQQKWFTGQWEWPAINRLKLSWNLALTLSHSLKRATLLVRFPFQRLHCDQQQFMKVFQPRGHRDPAWVTEVSKRTEQTAKSFGHKSCISLVSWANLAHTEGISLTSLYRAEVKGDRKRITSMAGWFITAIFDIRC